MDGLYTKNNKNMKYQGSCCVYVRTKRRDGSPLSCLTVRKKSGGHVLRQHFLKEGKDVRQK